MHLLVRRKTPQVEAMQWSHHNTEDLVRWAQGGWKEHGIWLKQEARGESLFWAMVLPDDSHVHHGDWVVKQPRGNLSAVKADEFSTVYEEAK